MAFKNTVIVAYRHNNIQYSDFIVPQIGWNLRIFFYYIGISIVVCQSRHPFNVVRQNHYSMSIFTAKVSSLSAISIIPSRWALLSLLSLQYSSSSPASFSSSLLHPPSPFILSTYLRISLFIYTYLYLCNLYQGERLTVFIMGSQERPSFFCSRPDGTLTPLLAVDELPLTLSIRGVSRTLTPGDTQGMTSCGVAPPRTDHWVVDGPPAGSRVTNDDKMNELHNLLYKILREEDVSSEVRSSIQEILFRGFDAPTSVPALAPATVAGAGQNRKDSPNFGYGGNFHGNHKNVSCQFTGWY